MSGWDRWNLVFWFHYWRATRKIRRLAHNAPSDDDGDGR